MGSRSPPNNLQNSFVLVRILLGVGAEGSLIVCGLRSSTSGTS